MGMMAAWLAAPVGAQSVDVAKPSLLTLDLTVGLQVTAGEGTYRDDQDEYSSLGGDVLLSVRAFPLLGGYVVGGVSASSHLAARGFDALCVPDGVGGCVPNFPSLGMVVGHLGLETSSGSSRILVGLGSVSSDVADRSLGAQLRFEGAAGLARHVALVFGLRLTLIPDHGGNSFNVFAGGLGVRLR